MSATGTSVRTPPNNFQFPTPLMAQVADIKRLTASYNEAPAPAIKDSYRVVLVDRVGLLTKSANDYHKELLIKIGSMLPS